MILFDFMLFIIFIRKVSFDVSFTAFATILLATVLFSSLH